MPLPTGYKPRKGDILSIHATVKHNFTASGGDIYLEVDGHFSTIALKSEQIDRIVRQKFEIGSRVLISDMNQIGFVRAISGDYAWIKLDLASEHYVTKHLNEITRVAEPDAEDELPAEEPPARPQAA